MLLDTYTSIRVLEGVKSSPSMNEVCFPLYRRSWLELTWRVSVIIDFCARTQNPPWSEQQTRQNIINVYNVQEVSNFSEVDVSSIMMLVLPFLFLNHLH